MYVLSQWSDLKHKSDVYRYNLAVIVQRQETHLPFSILTATVTASLGLSLSMPRASAITTWPKHPSPRGLPSVNLLTTNRATRKTDRELFSYGNPN